MSKTARRIMGVAATVPLLLDLEGNAWAATADDLGKSLTPIGAERAGNADGTIPAWTGGDLEVAQGWKVGDPRVDRYAGEKKLSPSTHRMSTNMPASSRKGRSR